MTKNSTRKPRDAQYTAATMTKGNKQYFLVARTKGDPLPQKTIETLRDVNMKDKSQSLKWTYAVI